MTFVLKNNYKRTDGLSWKKVTATVFKLEHFLFPLLNLWPIEQILLYLHYYYLQRKTLLYIVGPSYNTRG